MEYRFNQAKQYKRTSLPPPPPPLYRAVPVTAPFFFLLLFTLSFCLPFISPLWFSPCTVHFFAYMIRLWQYLVCESDALQSRVYTPVYPGWGLGIPSVGGATINHVNEYYKSVPNRPSKFSWQWMSIMGCGLTPLRCCTEIERHCHRYLIRNGPTQSLHCGRYKSLSGYFQNKWLRMNDVCSVI